MKPAGTPTRTSSNGSTISEPKTYVELSRDPARFSTCSRAQAWVASSPAPHNLRLNITRVLPGQADDQYDRRLREGRPSRAPVRVRPAPSDERPVPSQDRIGGDQERRPSSPRNKPGQSSDERSVGPGETGSGDLAAKDIQPLAEHQDLGVFGDGVHTVHPPELNEAASQAVEEAEHHGTVASTTRSRLVKLRIELLGFSIC